jgi:hypothetical protein
MDNQEPDLLEMILDGYKDRECSECGKKAFIKTSICSECDEEKVNRPTLIESNQRSVDVVNTMFPMDANRQKEIFKLTRHLWCAKRSSKCVQADDLDLEELTFYPEGRPLFASAHWACPCCGKIKSIASYEELV